MLSSISRLGAYAAIGLAYLFGGASLMLFMVFLIAGPVGPVDVGLEEAGKLIWDGCLCLAFIIQHSGMVRRSFHRWLARFVPEELGSVVYAISSGIVLLAVMLFWQGSTRTLWAAEGPLRWLFRAVSGLAVLGFIWTGRSLVSFDPLGTDKVSRLLRRVPPAAARLVVAGPYRWVRHPLYSLSIVLIWSYPELTADRLLFDVLFTVWIIVGAYLEERDLTADFGESYRTYRRRVPMLIPWRKPCAVVPQDQPADTRRS
jgi:methanethiol S-methyltransferase